MAVGLGLFEVWRCGKWVAVVDGFIGLKWLFEMRDGRLQDFDLLKLSGGGSKTNETLFNLVLTMGVSFVRDKLLSRFAFARFTREDVRGFLRDFWYSTELTRTSEANIRVEMMAPKVEIRKKCTMIIKPESCDHTACTAWCRKKKNGFGLCIPNPVKNYSECFCAYPC
ncbi:hypothetical protein M5K25_000901 [Dendrobium thyrsiflorum]|uniref:Defensin-like protein n=1 Tax=Dendrobium thyrsiflorum TaxID=117978 RepID=A0ABD0WE69_DENTH